MTARALPRPVSPVADLVSLVKPRLSSLVLCTLAAALRVQGLLQQREDDEHGKHASAALAPTASLR